MRRWLLTILILVCTITLCFNFARLVVVPTASAADIIDFRDVLRQISDFDVDITPLYLDLVRSLEVLNANFITMLKTANTLFQPPGVLEVLLAIWDLVAMPVQLIIVFITTAIDFIGVALQLVYALFSLLNWLFLGVLN